MNDAACNITECPNPAFARSMCRTHYSRWRKGKELDAPVRLRVISSLEAAFWARVEKTPTCWLWRGAIKPNGYGRLNNDYAHRISYRLAELEIPAGLHLDHLCRVRHCVNPAHLEPVTPQENLLRGEGHGRETQCPAGHAYDRPNTYIDPGGHRHCRVCRRTKALARYHLRNSSVSTNSLAR